MSIAHAVEAGRIRVEVSGDMDLRTAPAIRETLDALIARYPGRDLMMDLKGVTFIDSAGLGVLLGRYRRLDGHGVRLILIGVSPGVYAILKLAGLTQLAIVDDAMPRGAAQEARD